MGRIKTWQAVAVWFAVAFIAGFEVRGMHEHELKPSTQAEKMAAVIMSLTANENLSRRDD